MFLADMILSLLETPGDRNERRRRNPRAIDRKILRRFVRKETRGVKAFGECPRHLRVPEIGPKPEVVVPMVLEVCVLRPVGEENRILSSLKPAACMEDAWIENHAVSRLGRGPLSVSSQQI